MSDKPIVLNSLVESEGFSAGNLIGVAFPKSPSRAYSETVAIAQRAKAYGEFYLGNKLYHSAVFGLDKAQASYAFMVIDACRNWKGTKLFAQGRLLTEGYTVNETLKCYLDSLTPKDHRAHCHFIYDDIRSFTLGKRNPPGDRHLIPCRKLQGFTRDVVRDNVSTPEDAISQLAIRKSTFWCPHFDASAYKKSVGYPGETYEGEKMSKHELLNTPLLELFKRLWK